MVQQDGLHLGNGHFSRLAAGFHGQRGQCARRLAQARHDRLEPGAAVHLPGDRDGLVGHQEVVHIHGNDHAQRHAEGRDFPEPQVRELLVPGILDMVMVHGVVAHGDGPGV